MYITKVEIDFREGWANDPTIIVELNNYRNPQFFPSMNSPVWENYNGIHLAIDHDPVIAPYFYSDGKPTEGFAGRTFSGTFMSGKTFKYKGAWSSRAACVNAVCPEGYEVVDVTIGYCSTGIWAQSMIAALLDPTVEKVNFHGLVWADVGDNAPILLPLQKDGTLKDPWGRNKIIARVI